MAKAEVKAAAGHQPMALMPSGHWAIMHQTMLLSPTAPASDLGVHQQFQSLIIERAPMASPLLSITS